MSGSNSIRVQWGTAPSITFCLTPWPNHAELSGGETPAGQWPQTQQLKMTPGIWGWDRRALGFTSYLPMLLPTANKLCFAQSHSGDLHDCLNKEPCGIWAPPPTCHPLRICKHQSVRATNRPRRTMAIHQSNSWVSFKVRPLNETCLTSLDTLY